MISWRESLIAFATSVVILVTSVPTPARSEALKGTYASPGMAIVVHFDQCNYSPETTCGTLIWGWDGENDLTLPFGAVVAPGLRRTDAGWEGRLTDPVSGRTFRGTVVRAGRDQLLLQGCAGPFCTTERWYSLKSLEAVIEQLNRRSI